MGLYQRKDSPSWWFRVPLGKRGRAIRVNTRIPIDGGTPEQTAENRRLALRAYAIKAGTVAKGPLDIPAPAPPAAAVPTVKDHLAWYGAHVCAPRRSWPREQYIAAAYIAAFGSVRLPDLTQARIVEWRTARLAQGASPKTVARAVAWLSGALNHAVRAGSLAVNPCRGLPRLRGAAPAPIVLSRADEARLLKVLAPADRALVVVALDTILRLSNVVNLCRRETRGGWLDVAGKTGQYRPPLSRRARQALDRLEPCKAHGHYWPQYAHRPEPQQRKAVAAMLRDACAAIDLDYGRRSGLTWHSLRHTGATRMLEAGADVRTVQELGGWRSLDMLMQYTHPSAAAKARAVELVGKGGRHAGRTAPRNRAKSGHKSGR